jgi:hypothetical protein
MPKNIEWVLSGCDILGTILLFVFCYLLVTAPNHEFATLQYMWLPLLSILLVIIRLSIENYKLKLLLIPL